MRRKGTGAMGLLILMVIVSPVVAEGELERAALSAVEAPAVNQALVAVLLALLAVLAMAVLWLLTWRQQGDISTKQVEGQGQLIGVLVTQQAAIGTQNERLEENSATLKSLAHSVAQLAQSVAAQTRAMEAGQDIQSAAIELAEEARTAIINHEDKTEERVGRVIQQIEIMDSLNARRFEVLQTNLGEVDKTVKGAAEQMVAAVRPILENLGEIRVKLEREQAAIERISETVQEAQLQILTAIKDVMEAERETPEQTGRVMRGDDGDGSPARDGAGRDAGGGQPVSSGNSGDSSAGDGRGGGDDTRAGDSPLA